MHHFIQKILGKTCYYLIKANSLTWRLTYFAEDGYKRTTPYIFCGWHESLVGPFVTASKIHKTPLATLVSNSKDGEILHTILKNFGFSNVRGSSNKFKKSSMKELEETLLHKRCSIGVTVDGPRGPARKAKLGAIGISKKYKIPLIPMAAAYSLKITFNSWDKFQLPLPFSKVVICYGKPFLPNEDLEVARQELENCINDLSQQANNLLEF